MRIHHLRSEICLCNNTMAAKPMYSRLTVFASAALMLACTCLFATTILSAEPSKIEFGMSPQQVIGHLGAPDRVATFEGKYLRDVPFDGLQEAQGDGQFVFIYRKIAVRVQFTENRVTGVEQGGADLTNPTGDKAE